MFWRHTLDWSGYCFWDRGQRKLLTNSRDKELGTGIDYDLDEFVQLSLGVIIAIDHVSACPGNVEKLGYQSLCLPCASSNLGEKKINTKGSILVLQEALQLGNLLS